MADETDSVKIARIDEWSKQHTKEDDKRESEANIRFERMFTYLDKRFTEIDNNITKQFNTVGKKIEGMGTTVSELWDEKKERDGADKNQSRWQSFGGYSLNAVIAAFTAWATFKLIK